MAERHTKANALLAKCGYKSMGGSVKDSAKAYKRGGAVGTKVNVIVAPQGGAQMPPMMTPHAPPMGPAVSGPALPTGAAPGIPPGLPPKPPGVMKRGGAIQGGGGGALGRLRKIKEYG